MNIFHRVKTLFVPVCVEKSLRELFPPLTRTFQPFRRGKSSHGNLTITPVSEYQALMLIFLLKDGKLSFTETLMSDEETLPIRAGSKVRQKCELFTRTDYRYLTMVCQQKLIQETRNVQKQINKLQSQLLQIRR